MLSLSFPPPAPPAPPAPLAPPTFSMPPRPVIDLSIKVDSENLTSYSRGNVIKNIEQKPLIEETMIKKICKGYKKSFLVLILVLLLMNNYLDAKIIEKVSLLGNNMIMLSTKAIILAIVYHIVSICVLKN